MCQTAVIPQMLLTAVVLQINKDAVPEQRSKFLAMPSFIFCGKNRRFLKCGVNCALMSIGRMTAHEVKRANSTICACYSSNFVMDVVVIAIAFPQLVRYIQRWSNSNVHVSS